MLNCAASNSHFRSMNAVRGGKLYNGRNRPRGLDERGHAVPVLFQGIANFASKVATHQAGEVEVL